MADDPFPLNVCPPVAVPSGNRASIPVNDFTGGERFEGPRKLPLAQGFFARIAACAAARRAMGTRKGEQDT